MHNLLGLQKYVFFTYNYKKKRERKKVFSVCLVCNKWYVVFYCHFSIIFHLYLA